MDLTGINLDRPEMRREGEVDPDIGAAQRKVNRIANQVRDRSSPPNGRAPLREGEKLVRQLGSTPAGVFGDR